MHSKLLVPLDGSGFGEEILPYAAVIARNSGADVAVAHVHVPHVPDHLISNTQYQYEGLDLEEYDGRDRSQEEEYIRSKAEQMAEELGRPAEPLLLEGEVPDAIDAWAEGAEVQGMIVMATHGRTGFSRAWLGSVADAVVRSAPWPVLLVRPCSESELPCEPDFRRILVPLDGSERSERILPHAVALAEGAGASLELLQVVTPSTARGTRVLPVSMEVLESAKRRAEDYLEGMATDLGQEGLEVATRVVEHQQPARAILDAIEESRPDLVAMATHGYRGVTRVVLGSVADKVLRAAPIPLLLLGPGVRA